MRRAIRRRRLALALFDRLGRGGAPPRRGRLPSSRHGDRQSQRRGAGTASQPALRARGPQRRDPRLLRFDGKRSARAARARRRGAFPPRRMTMRHEADCGDSRRIAWALALTTGYFFAEVIGGLLTNSLALLSDAGHMFSDIGEQREAV